MSGDIAQSFNRHSIQTNTNIQRNVFTLNLSVEFQLDSLVMAKLCYLRSKRRPIRDVRERRDVTGVTAF